MKNDNFDKNLFTSVAVMIVAVLTLGISSLNLMFHYVFSETTYNYQCKSSYSTTPKVPDYAILSAESIANLSSGYVMLKTFRTLSNEVAPESQIHQSVILSKDIDYQFQINCAENEGHKIVFEMYTPHEHDLVKWFYLPSNKAKLNVKVPKTGLYVIRLYDETHSNNLSGVLTIGGKSR